MSNSYTGQDKMRQQEANLMRKQREGNVIIISQVHGSRSQRVEPCTRNVSKMKQSRKKSDVLKQDNDTMTHFKSSQVPFHESWS